MEEALKVLNLRNISKSLWSEALPKQRLSQALKMLNNVTSSFLYSFFLRNCTVH